METAHPGDANRDGLVDVGDLGILAANYGQDLATDLPNATAWEWYGYGDFNSDGVVDVGDLGILAANYGFGTSSTSAANFAADYEKVFTAAIEYG